MRAVVWCFVLLAVAYGAFRAMTVEVAPGETVIVLRFGDPRRVLDDDPGLHMRWPWPVDEVLRVDRRLHVLDPDAGECLTLDDRSILVNAFAVWQVSDARRYVERLNDRQAAENRLQNIVLSEVGNVVGGYPMSSLISHEASDVTVRDLADEITRRAHARAMESFGVEIGAVRIKRIGFPSQNKQAVFQRMRAERSRVATAIRSEGERAAASIRLEADQERAERLAKADEEAAALRGAAEAEVTRIYGEAFSKDPAFYEFRRSLEVYRTLFGEDDTVVLPEDSWLLRFLRGDEALVEPGRDG